jgi:protocatechuate 3,4-dioxygenase, beta subunit
MRSMPTRRDGPWGVRNREVAMTAGDLGRPSRRGFIAGSAVALGGVALTVRRGLAARLPLTPAQMLGPFYPVELPLDADNDLVVVQGAAAAALGTVAHVFGRVLGPDGAPVAGARVEIWQCDATGIYLHPRDPGVARRDGGFQGYGQTVTAADGGYRFRTIRPVPYPGRTPHIHFAVSGDGFAPLVTQLYVAGEPRNAADGVLNRLDPDQQQQLMAAFAAAPELEAEALAATFDIVVAA